MYIMIFAVNVPVHVRVNGGGCPFFCVWMNVSVARSVLSRAVL